MVEEVLTPKIPKIDMVRLTLTNEPGRYSVAGKEIKQAGLIE